MCAYIYYIYHIFFIHSSVDGHLGCFNVLDVVNRATMNIRGACIALSYSFFGIIGDLPNPGIEPRSHALQGVSLPAETQGKPKNTGRGSLSFLQGDLPDPGNERGSPALQGWLLTNWATRETWSYITWVENDFFSCFACFAACPPAFLRPIPVTCHAR